MWYANHNDAGWVNPNPLIVRLGGQTSNLPIGLLKRSGSRPVGELETAHCRYLEPIPKPLTGCEWVGTSAAASFGNDNRRTKGDDDVPSSISARFTAPAAPDPVGGSRRHVELDSI